MENERLISLRKQAGITQQGLADAIGISQSMVALIESGQREPRKKIRIELVRFFSKTLSRPEPITVEWLFYESEYNQQSSMPDSKTA